MKLIKTIKKSKLYYYFSNGILDLIPKSFFEKKLNFWLQKAINPYSEEEIKERVNYYCSFSKDTKINSSFVEIKDYKRPQKHSVHYFDLKKVTRYFSSKLKIAYLFGDVTENQNHPTFVKSRPINHNGNSVLLKLNELRHFNFITDKKSFEEKENTIVWRGVIHKENRKLLFDNYFGNPKFNLGTTRKKNSKSEWIKPYLSIEEQLKSKFILSIEGIDVATNLKWVMSSNSLCFMPKPKFETWYMEGKLISDYHYVLVKDDYSDVEEKMNYYSKNTEEAKIIIANANSWTSQFRNRKLEKIIALSVAKKFFENTNQL